MQIEWRNRARKQLRKLGDRQTKERILAAIEAYAAGYPADVIALVGHEYTHRLRVGSYRVLMTVDQTIEVSIIEEVRKRDDRTY
jgi:mRNA-degrading endonuclease RelE of RelBE toxin-antitoxin system